VEEETYKSVVELSERVSDERWNGNWSKQRVQREETTQRSAATLARVQTAQTHSRKRRRKSAVKDGVDLESLSLSSNKKPLADTVSRILHLSFRFKQSRLRQHTVLHHLLTSPSLLPKKQVTRVTHSHLREKQCDSNAVLLLKVLRVLLKSDKSGLDDTLGESREARSR